MRTPRFWITLAILFVANILISNVLVSAGQPPTVTISYNSFLDQVNAGNVASITSTGESITGVAKQPVKDSSGTSSTKFQTQRPSFANDDLQAMLQQHNVVINAKDPNASTPLWETLLFSFGPTILLVLGFLYLSRRAARAEFSALSVRAERVCTTPNDRRSASQTSRASTRSRRTCRRSWTSSVSRRSTSVSVARCPKACS